MFPKIKILPKHCPVHPKKLLSPTIHSETVPTFDHNIKSELSGGGVKREVEKTPKFTLSPN